MSKDKYPSIFLSQGAIVFIIQIFFAFNTHGSENWWIFLDVPQFQPESIRSHDEFWPTASLSGQKYLMDFKFPYCMLDHAPSEFIEKKVARLKLT